MPVNDVSCARDLDQIEMMKKGRSTKKNGRCWQQIWFIVDCGALEKGKWCATAKKLSFAPILLAETNFKLRIVN